MKLSIIIPAYNEERRIGKTLEAYSDFFESLRKKKILDYELLVSINNTKDRTEDIVKKFVKKNKQIRYLNLVKGGKGYATIEGFKDALKRDSDLIGFVDADMATSPEEYYKLLENIGDYDCAIASRYLKGSKVYPPVTFRRLIVGRVFNYLIKLLLFLNIDDTQCGAKLFKREALTKILPHVTFSKWAFDVDLLYQLKKHGFKIKEVPTVWVDKEYSKINFLRAAPWMTLGIIRLRLINSPLRFTLKFYDKINKFIYKIT